MKILLAPSGLDGFFAAFYASYYDHRDAVHIAPADTLRTMLDEYVDIAPSPINAKKVRAAIVSKGGRAVLDDVRDAFRAGNAHKHDIIAAFLRLFFKVGRAACSRFGDAAVTEFNDLIRRVHGELHRLSGFVRFQETDVGAYYGYYSSDNDIIDLLGNEFSFRFNTQPFVLHDYKRGTMFCYDGNMSTLLPAPACVEITLSNREAVFKSLWWQYHKNVSIKGRENRRLQRGFSPKKYRHFMSEFDPDGTQ